jgi:hypothetical protein
MSDGMKLKYTKEFMGINILNSISYIPLPTNQVQLWNWPHKHTHNNKQCTFRMNCVIVQLYCVVSNSLSSLPYGGNPTTSGSCSVIDS